MDSGKEYFYCYSRNLYSFLKLGKSVRYICTGLHVQTHQQFWVFERSDELHQYLTKYKERGVEKGVIAP